MAQGFNWYGGWGGAGGAISKREKSPQQVGEFGGAPIYRTSSVAGYRQNQANAVTPTQRIQQYLLGLAGSPLHGISLDGQKKLAAALNLESLGVMQPMYLSALQGLGGLLQQAQELQPAQSAFTQQALAMTQNVDPMVIAQLAARKAGQAALSQGMQNARAIAASNPSLAKGAQLAAQNAAARAQNAVLAQGMDYGNMVDTIGKLAAARAGILQSGISQSPIGQFLSLLGQHVGQATGAVMGAQQQPKQQGGNDLAGVLGTVLGLATGIKGFLK